MKSFYAELSKRQTIIDPTLTVWEQLMTSDGTAILPEYAPFAEIAPASVTRSWKIGGYPLSEGLTRDDYRKSFTKMVQLVGKLHQAGVRIVAGTAATSAPDASLTRSGAVSASTNMATSRNFFIGISSHGRAGCWSCAPAWSPALSWRAPSLKPVFRKT